MGNPYAISGFSCRNQICTVFLPRGLCRFLFDIKSRQFWSCFSKNNVRNIRGLLFLWLWWTKIHDIQSLPVVHKFALSSSLVFCAGSCLMLKAGSLSGHVTYFIHKWPHFSIEPALFPAGSLATPSVLYSISYSTSHLDVNLHLQMVCVTTFET